MHIFNNGTDTDDNYVRITSDFTVDFSYLDDFGFMLGSGSFDSLQCRTDNIYTFGGDDCYQSSSVF